MFSLTERVPPSRSALWRSGQVIHPRLARLKGGHARCELNSMLNRSAQRGFAGCNGLRTCCGGEGWAVIGFGQRTRGEVHPH
jgi:hypothetical protein